MRLLAVILAVLLRPATIIGQPTMPGAPPPTRCYCGHPRHDHQAGTEWCTNPDRCGCSYFQPLPAA